MSFQLSPELDKNKIFLIKRSELEGRLDPFFYTPQFYNVMNLERLSKYPIKKVSHLSYLVTDGIHKTPSYDEKGLPFIQANNISEGIIGFDEKTKRVTEEWQTEVLNRYTPKAGDILVTKDGTIGIAATVPNQFKPFSIFVSVLAIRPQEYLAIPEYLRISISSNIVQKQIVRSTRGAVLAHLLLEETRELKIPIPPKEIQAQIVAKMNTAYAAKKQKEAETKALLESIDAYLLEGLGIQLPAPEENTLANRIFTRQLSDVSGGRFDAEYYQDKYVQFENAILAINQYVLLLLESGSRPAGGVCNIESGVLSFGGTHVSNDGYINTEQAKYIPVDYHQKILITATKINDLLLVKDGATTGKVAIIQDTKHENQNINEHIFLMRLKDNINPIYLLSYLKSSFGSMQIRREITGATVTGLTKDVVKNLKIPLPPIEKQTEIADHISEIRKQAKHLQQQAQDELAQAKKEVEAMILGEEESEA